MCSVSYTHLDVYKRQGYTRLATMMLTPARPAMRQRLPRSIGSVSYTHLDVYKRQVVGIDSVREADGQWRVRSHTGNPDAMRAPSKTTLGWVVQAQRLGAGEIVLNCMGSDGVRSGYDIDQLRAVRAPVSYTHLDVYKRQELVQRLV